MWHRQNRRRTRTCPASQLCSGMWQNLWICGKQGEKTPSADKSCFFVKRRSVPDTAEAQQNLFGNNAPVAGHRKKDRYARRQGKESKAAVHQSKSKDSRSIRQVQIGTATTLARHFEPAPTCQEQGHMRHTLAPLPRLPTHSRRQQRLTLDDSHPHIPWVPQMHPCRHQVQGLPCSCSLNKKHSIQTNVLLGLKIPLNLRTHNHRERDGAETGWTKCKSNNSSNTACQGKKLHMHLKQANTWGNNKKPKLVVFGHACFLDSGGFRAM